MNAELQRVAEALDAGPMGPRLDAALGAGSTHVLDGKYEPGLKALVLYEHAGGLVRGDVQLDGTEVSDGLVVDPGVRLSVFPDDPGLPTLPDALDRARLGAALGAVCTDVSLLRYRPGKRATVRLAVGPGGHAGIGTGGHAVIGTGGHAVIGKVYHDASKAAAVAGEAAARAAEAHLSRHLCLAPTVAHVDELRLVVQAIVAGAPLGALVEHERGPFPGALDGVRRAVEALVELHEGPVVSTRERPVRRELVRFAQRAARIEGVDPRAGAALGALAERLLDLDAGLPPGPVGLVHGDCKPSQFLLRDDDRVALLDLDHLGTGDQAGDVGTFAATLAQLAIRHELAGAPTAHRRAMAALEQAAVDTYLQRRALPGLRARVDWHIAVALERKALRAFARAPLSPLATALAGEGHRRLDSLLGVAA